MYKKDSRKDGKMPEISQMFWMEFPAIFIIKNRNNVMNQLAALKENSYIEQK